MVGDLVGTIANSIRPPNPRPSSVGSFQPVTGGPGAWTLDMNRNGVVDSSESNMYRLGFPGSTPIGGGDWNGDGLDEIGVYSAGKWYRDVNGNGTWDATDLAALVTYGPTSGVTPMVGDWNGDGKDEIGYFQPGC